MNYYIARNGITNTKPDIGELPLREEVDFCKEILALVEQRDTSNKSSTSYGYKHMLEKSFANGYIANGSFIQAATELKMNVTRLHPDSPNAVFKFTPQDLNLALMNYCINKQNISLPEPTKETIKEQLIECQSKSKKIPVEILSDLYKHFNVDIGVKGLFPIIKEASLKIKYDFGHTIQNGNDEFFGSQSTVNISLSKLSKLLQNKAAPEQKAPPSKVRFYF